MNTKTTPERLKSLDILRGFDMFWITGGSALLAALAGATNGSFLEAIEEQMHHVKWSGFQFYDLIFPLFMFIMGVAIPYALIPKMESGTPRRALYKKIIKRFVLLVFFGFIYNNASSQDWSNPRVASVLGQIGFAYLFAAVIFINTRSIVYGLFQNLMPVPGYGAGVLTADGSINAFLDQHITPGRLYGGTYDPEGVINNISAVGITLMGVLAGLILRSKKISSQYRKVIILAGMGTLFLVLAYLLRDVYPVIKKIWTSTFNLHAGGISLLLLALFYLVIDVWKFEKWGFYFKVIGMNSITIYLGYHFIRFGDISESLLNALAGHLGDAGDILLSLGTLAIIWYCLYWLYKNKIFLRV
jgi:predicted acyltransferase